MLRAMFLCMNGWLSAIACLFLFIFCVLCVSQPIGARDKPNPNPNPDPDPHEPLAYIWPLPAEFTFGDKVVSVNPGLSLAMDGNGGRSAVVRAAFHRYKGIVFKHIDGHRFGHFRKLREIVYDINRLTVTVHSHSEELQLGVDESYTLLVSKGTGGSNPWKVTIEANTVYGALRALETFSQLCSFDYTSKKVQIHNAPWSIHDKPRFAYRGLLLDTSRHYLPIDVIKHIIESMSYAKLNVLHWHIIDEQSFPLEVKSYPKLWKGSYTKWERYTVEDAYDIVKASATVLGSQDCKDASSPCINVMAEVDVPGHAESWGAGYPELWPSPSCKEPLDVSKKFTFDVISGILTGLVPIKLYSLGSSVLVIFGHYM
ncbi:beta-hexosaminidase 1-like [Senna tora]|uniref:beta-N-acetylhexosaminidase n=1 Tax=Senna tora TaxID=362788 RepID=A0A834SYU0_9FABA|nr:beta-hexosaminidase 1-like [Senna tora]